MSSSVRVKPGFHYLSWRPELTVPVSITRQHGPCWRARVSTIAELTVAFQNTMSTEWVAVAAVNTFL